MYENWNYAIASRFFRPEFAGRPVCMYLTTEIVDALGASFNEGAEEFIKSIKTGPSGITRDGVCQKAYQAFRRWRTVRGDEYPPYIAYLGLFVLAAGKEGDFAPNAYYPRLWTLLREPEKTGTLPSFHLMSELWSDLERWSNQDRRGELGIFNVLVAGGWIHVGIPISQTILSEHERNALPRIFADAQIDPTSQPPDLEFASLLKHYGSHELRPRTRNLLARPRDETYIKLHEILLESLRNELAVWDCSLNIPQHAFQQQNRPTGIHPVIANSEDKSDHGANAEDTINAKVQFGALRICAELDRVAGKLSTYFRCASTREFPENGLLLTTGNVSELFTCEESLPGWSTPLIDSARGLRIDASQYDWNQGLEYDDLYNEWRVRLQPRPIRVFISGANEGFAGLIEVKQLFPSMAFYIAAEASHVRHLQAWGEKYCIDFKEIKLISGIQNNYKFFGSAGATSDDMIRDLYPFLSFSENLTVRLLGGVKSARGNTYFDFGLPRIILEGGTGAEKAICKTGGSEIELQATNGTRTYEFPAGIKSGTDVGIEIQRVADGHQEVVRRRSIFVQNEFDWKMHVREFFVDKFGRALEDPNGDIGIAGALINVSVRTLFQPILPFELFEAQQIIFIGPVIGQIVFWPEESLLEDWQPMWAIKMKKDKGRVVYCGRNQVLPIVNEATIHPRKRRAWNEVLWHWRKRILAPPHRKLRTLWKEYQRVAQHVS